VYYTPQKAWKAIHFIMHILKKENNNMKCLDYMAPGGGKWFASDTGDITRG
jgi:hypothetical protein